MTAAPSAPAAFVRQVIDTVLPLGDSPSGDDLCKALTPFFAGYTVGDAALMLAMLKGAQRMEPVQSTVGENSREFHALYLAMTCLEDFAAFGYASGPECVAGRAFLAQADCDGEPMTTDWHDAAMRPRLLEDVAALRTGQYLRETFDKAPNRVTSWTMRKLQHEAAA